MDLKIRKDKRFNEPVGINFIHGKFPYKLYFRMRGNYLYGKYIVVVSSNEIKATGRINRVLIETAKKADNISTNTNNINSIAAVRPNEDVNGYIIYAVDPVNVVDVASDTENNSVLVFNPVIKKKGVIQHQ